MTERRCQACRHFYDKKQGDCPNCGAAPHGFNKWLRTAQLNNGLYRQAEQATSDKRRYVQAKRERLTGVG